ncbi:MAG: HAMP domain-containing protein [Cyclobacteriaceae bacterium]|nr:HAMP domain-containing protein [Cyclobacteriaceae bacterium]
MNWNPFKSIRAKTAFIFFGVFVVIVLPVNFLVYSKVETILIQADTRELQAEGEKLFDKVRLDPALIPLPPQNYLMFIRIKEVLGIDTVFASPGFPEVWSEDAVLVLDSIKIVTQARPVPYSNALLLLSIARSTHDLDNQLETLRLYLFIANSISILLAGILVYIVSGFTLRPVRNIVEVASRIQATRSMERVAEPKSDDEYRELARTINGMLTRIESSIKTQTNFFASAAHELKTPLTVMQTELSVALNQNPEPSTRTILENQLHEVQRLDRVIQDFLLISQLKSESLVIRKAVNRLDEALYSALKRCKYQIKRKNAQVKITLATEDCTSNFDYDKTELVLFNLLENAIKYSQQEATIQVTINRTDRLAVQFVNPVTETITDVEILKSEFKKVNELSSGLGMGLWICQEIMRLQDGELNLHETNGDFIAEVVI